MLCSCEFIVGFKLCNLREITTPLLAAFMMKLDDLFLYVNTLFPKLQEVLLYLHSVYAFVAIIHHFIHNLTLQFVLYSRVTQVTRSGGGK
jgi:hypothetical protein